MATFSYCQDITERLLAVTLNFSSNKQIYKVALNHISTLQYYKSMNPYHMDQMSCNIRNCIFGHVRSAKIQISLHIRAVWSESSLCTFWTAKDAKNLHADNKDWSDWADAQAELSLLWALMSESPFFNVADHIYSGKHSEQVFWSLSKYS